MSAALSIYPLPPSVLARLTASGFFSIKDLDGFSPDNLSKECGINEDEAIMVLRLVKDGASRGISALQLLDDPLYNSYIVTFSQQIDYLLGGGIFTGKVTEVFGVPGSGKTQLCLQLAVSVQLPECFGGVGGEALYVDTERGMVSDRVRDIAEAALSHCQLTAQQQNLQEQREVTRGLSVESFLVGISVIYCDDYTELLALVHTLPTLLNTNNKIKLVIIDSVAQLFKHAFDDWGLRSRILHGLAQNLSRLAHQNNLAVVLTNHMMTRPGQSGAWSMTPALGSSWGHASSLRLLLHHHGNERRATLYKGTRSNQASVPFQITTGGVRDVHKCTEKTDHSCTTPPAKRQRVDD